MATAQELKELEDTLVLIEAEAINELNTKSENLPTHSKNLSEVEAAKVQLAEMTWECVCTPFGVSVRSYHKDLYTSMSFAFT